MKTLLLTLVVVTIVCLDLGYTMICHNQQSADPPTTQTCPGETNCYRKDWSDHRGSRTERGCGCPTVKPGIKLKCCKTDKCNR